MISRKGILYFSYVFSKEKYFRQSLLRSNVLYSSHQTKSTVADNVVSRTNKINDTLMEIGLTSSVSHQLELKHPEISKMTKEELGRCVDTFAKLQFGEGRLDELIGKHPYLLCLDPTRIEGLFMELTPLFDKSEIFKIFINSPRVFYEPIQKVIDKANYLDKVMGVSKGQIVNSGALNHSLNYIKLRHDLLVKVGVFKKVNPKAKAHEKLNLNPRIDIVLNTTDFDFASKVAKISAMEFEVFKDLFHQLDEEED